MVAADLSAAAARTRTAPPEEDKAPEVVPAECAILVFRKPTGEIVFTHDINTPIQVSRPVTFDDVYGMLHVVLKDIEVNQAAGLSAQANAMMSNMARQAGAGVPGGPDLDQILKNLNREHG